MKRRLIIIIVVILVFLATGYALRDRIFPLLFLPQKSPEAIEGLKKKEITNNEIVIVAEELEIPWELAFLPGGEMLIAERPGKLIMIGEDIISIPVEGVRHVGEGGLLGMVLHPQFEDNFQLYLYMTSDTERGIENRVVRYLFKDGELSEKIVILEGILGARFHNGGRIDFGPDGYLYITTGDSQQADIAQDSESLAGKILRVRDDGSVPEENPFGNEIYSLGHRNPQGITWDREGQLWSTEHGPTARDEINMIESGKNYGWPEITGPDQREGMETAILYSGTGYTWAPAGMAYLDGKIFFGGLRGQALYEFDPKRKTIKEHFKEEFGRIRIVRVGPDGNLYIGTSNRDGRGFAEEKDDRIIRLNPEIFGL